MRLFIPIIVLMLSFFLLLSGCKKSTEQQMQEYIEFYYPASGQYTYVIDFDWGTYTINTGPGAEEELHAESEPYRGFISIRPDVKQNNLQEKLPVYLVTAKGEVWSNADFEDIPEIKTRKEVVVKKTESGTSTQTTTIQSALEPVVDHFLKNGESWTKYGVLESSNGKYTLKLVK